MQRPTILLHDVAYGTSCKLLKNFSIDVITTRKSVILERRTLTPQVTIITTPGYFLALEVLWHRLQIDNPFAPVLWLTYRPWEDGEQLWGLLWPPQQFVLDIHTVTRDILLHSTRRAIADCRPAP
jgi:hypothetical protein